MKEEQDTCKDRGPPVEITNEEFRDHRIIAFESNPTWVNLESCNNVIEKVKKVKPKVAHASTGHTAQASRTVHLRVTFLPIGDGLD